MIDGPDWMDCDDVGWGPREHIRGEGSDVLARAFGWICELPWLRWLTCLALAAVVINLVFATNLGWYLARVVKYLAYGMLDWIAAL